MLKEEEQILQTEEEIRQWEAMKNHCSTHKMYSEIFIKNFTQRIKELKLCLKK